MSLELLQNILIWILLIVITISEYSAWKCLRLVKKYSRFNNHLIRDVAMLLVTNEKLGATVRKLKSELEGHANKT